MKRVSAGGFTIVESLIVLGVTGVLFVSLVGMVSGQQSKARFKSAMNDITSHIQMQINEVSTGYYPNAGNFSCTVQTIGGVRRPAISSGVNTQGTNPACTFIGRVVMYAIPGTDPEQVKVQTLIGLRKTEKFRTPATLAEASPRVLASGNTFTSPVDASSTKTLQYGTTMAWMRRADGQRISGFGVVSMPNGQIAYGDNGAMESGTVIPVIVPIERGGGTSVGLTSQAGVDIITSTIASSTPADGPIKLCFRSGTTDQSGLVTIGGKYGSASVDSQIFSTIDCS